MSDVRELSDEALVDQFATNVFRYETDRTPSPWKEQVDLLEAELLRRLRARSVEGLVEAIREHVYYDTPEDHFVDPSIPLVGFEYVEDAILHWGGDTDGD